MRTLLLLLFIFSGTVLTAQTVITGKITDEKGTPLYGVTIKIKKRKYRNAKRRRRPYSIQVPDEKTILVFAYVGYEKQEIQVKGKTVINVKLKASSLHLDEVIVVGYSTQKNGREQRANVSDRDNFPLCCKAAECSSTGGCGITAGAVAHPETRRTDNEFPLAIARSW